MITKENNIHQPTLIYGAQAIALGTYKALKTLTPGASIRAFVVTEMGNNPATLAGLPVIELKSFVESIKPEDKDSIKVLIATPENVMGSIEKSLAAAGLHNYERVDSIYWNNLQEKAYLKNGLFTSLSTYEAGEAVAPMQIFKMVHHKDKQLKTAYDDPTYVTKLQVGAAKADSTVANLTDNTLDNISEKNPNYSELTGLYWIWNNKVNKAAEDTFFGLAHYRRFLDFSNEDTKKILSNSIDVILPYPMPYEPNIKEHHKRYLSHQEWDAVLQAMQELQPAYYKALDSILSQEYLYNYNIFLAQKDVFDDYCSWLFPLLFRIEQIVDPTGKREPNRYIGYIGETLETVYFMFNKDKLKIAHTGCRFLV